MIKIEVVTYNGSPPSRLLSATFDELGGNIGRAEGNALVLSDPGRSISRIHASVVCRGGKYFIRGLGSTTPVYLNEQPLNNGQDTAIADGDKIRIGDYVMQVMDHDTASNRGAIEPAKHQSLVPSNSLEDSQSLADLLAFPEAQAKQDSVLSKVEASDPTAQNILDPFAGSTDAKPRQTIPPDFDFFEDLSTEENKLSAAESSTNHGDPSELNPVLESIEKQPSIDDVINSSSPLMDLSQAQDENSVNDPLIALAEKTGKTGPKAQQRDDISELKSSLPPMHVYEKPVEVPPVAVESTEVSSATDEELLHAFLSGAGISNLEKPIKLTPQLMNQIGQLLRMSTQGTLDLLLARALMKREMRAEMTMISPRENNPLKLSPNVEAALMHLLFPKAREQGFMPPLQAMRDAYNDLRSHQFGFMAGMRAALAGILGRFNPGQLEKRLGHKTLVDSVFSLNRKANLWDMFTDRYGDISREAEEDFLILFSKEFLKAYEAQIAKFEMEDKKK